MRSGHFQPLLRTEDVATIFQVAPQTVRAWRRQGLLRAVQVGRELRFRRADVEALVGSPIDDLVNAKAATA